MGENRLASLAEIVVAYLETVLVYDQVELFEVRPQAECCQAIQSAQATVRAGANIGLAQPGGAAGLGANVLFTKSLCQIMVKT